MRLQQQQWSVMIRRLVGWVLVVLLLAPLVAVVSASESLSTNDYRQLQTTTVQLCRCQAIFEDLYGDSSNKRLVQRLKRKGYGKAIKPYDYSNSRLDDHGYFIVDGVRVLPQDDEQCVRNRANRRKRAKDRIDKAQQRGGMTMSVRRHLNSAIPLDEEDTNIDGSDDDDDDTARLAMNLYASRALRRLGKGEEQGKGNGERKRGKGNVKHNYLDKGRNIGKSGKGQMMSGSKRGNGKGKGGGKGKGKSYGEGKGKGMSTNGKGKGKTGKQMGQRSCRRRPLDNDCLPVIMPCAASKGSSSPNPETDLPTSAPVNQIIAAPTKAPVSSTSASNSLAPTTGFPTSAPQILIESAPTSLPINLETIPPASLPTMSNVEVFPTGAPQMFIEETLPTASPTEDMPTSAPVLLVEPAAPSTPTIAPTISTDAPTLLGSVVPTISLGSGPTTAPSLRPSSGPSRASCLACAASNACFTTSCRDDGTCLYTPLVSCPAGQSCDSTTGMCRSQNDLRPCVAVIDESSQSTSYLESKWVEFRTAYPARPFCLLQPVNSGFVDPANGNGLYLPSTFVNDTRATHFNITREDGYHVIPNTPPLANWFDLCNIAVYAATGVEFVGLYVDVSGSMDESTVRSMLANFTTTLNQTGLAFKSLYDGNEDWILPFLTDLSTL